jgi:hypothetical protein
MMRRLALATAFMALCLAPPAAAAQLPSIAEKTAGMRRIDGFIPIWWDEDNGKLYMEISVYIFRVIQQL